VSKGPLAPILAILAEAYLGQGRLAEAFEQAQQAVEKAQIEGEPFITGHAWRVFGNVLARMPDHIGAEACFAASLSLFTEIQEAGEQARTLRAWSRYTRQHGNVAQAASQWREAQAIFSRLGMTLELQRMAEEEATQSAEG
jgi:tetratricopeptide (TPR) repeat protein|nr:hypothetical protein [Chloroflexaceae bacterium]